MIAFCRLWLPFDELFDASFDEEIMAASPWPPELEGCPPGKRLAPVGANAEDDDEESCVDVKSIKSRAQSVDLESNFSSDFWLGGGDAAGVAAAAESPNNDKLEAQIRQLENDQEELNNSLMSMTSHFAKVQLRLQQVCVILI